MFWIERGEGISGMWAHGSIKQRFSSAPRPLLPRDNIATVAVKTGILASVFLNPRVQ